jgi:hypothetical protein
MFRHNEIVFLIGAGCSAEAGIPVSSTMRDELEKLLATNEDWRQFEGLYNYVKGAIIHAECLNGRGSSPPDIERLVIVLSELEKNETCLLYPFIGSWAPRLLQLTGHDFDVIRKFRKQILKRLKEWVITTDYTRKSEYYKQFFRFQSECNFPLRVFSLNYDLCLEVNAPDDKAVVRGFEATTRTWNGSLFEMRDEEDVTRVYLYKMHGSIDWKRYPEEGNVLKAVDNSDSPDLIFGTDYKMQSIDPYLFYLYEFRRCCLESKVIISIGYSFRDTHINEIIRQSLQRRPDRKLLVVSNSTPPDVVQIGSQAQTVCHQQKAKAFLEELSVAAIMDRANIKEADLFSTPLFQTQADDSPNT